MRTVARATVRELRERNEEVIKDFNQKRIEWPLWEKCPVLAAEALAYTGWCLWVRSRLRRGY